MKSKRKNLWLILCCAWAFLLFYHYFLGHLMPQAFVVCVPIAFPIQKKIFRASTGLNKIINHTSAPDSSDQNFFPTEIVAGRSRRATDICNGRPGCFQKTYLADNEAPPTQGNLLGRMDKMYKHYSVTMEIKAIGERTNFRVENVLHFAAASFGEKIRKKNLIAPHLPLLTPNERKKA